MMRAVGILGSIRIGMVHAVQNGIGAGREVGTSLPHPGKQVKKPFPPFGHDKHLMGSIPMEEETLTKQGEIPV